MQDQQQLQELAYKYFAGEISNEESRALTDYIGQGEAQRRQFRAWEDEWTAANRLNRTTRQRWLTLQQRLLLHAVDGRLPRRRSWRQWVAAAAVLLLLVVTATEGYLLLREEQFVCKAPLGSHTQLVLPDGTQVCLNAGSQLSYSSRFGWLNRKVQLQGEAFFDVTKHHGATFTVQTKGYDVVVRGTQFDVSAYDDDAFVSTELLRGKVEIHTPDTLLTLMPGQQATLYKRTRQLALSSLTRDTRAWMDNHISCDDITMERLAQILSRQYNMNIHIIGTNICRMTLTAELNNKETIDEIMSALQRIIPISVKRTGHDIYITHRRTVLRPA